MLQKTNGIVLHTIKYNDSSNIVDIFTELYGRMSFILSLPKSRKSVIKSSLFQPLAIVQIEADFHSQKMLIKIKNARLSYPYSSIPFDQGKTTIAFFLAEFMVHALKEEGENKNLFDFVQNSLIWFDNQTSNFANFHLVFLMHLAWFLGFLPNLENYHAGDYFDLQNSCFVSHKPLTHSFFLEPAEASHILMMTRMTYKNMHLFGLSRSQRNRCIEILIEYYRIHLPEFPELKSLSILREIFD